MDSMVPTAVAFRSCLKTTISPTKCAYLGSAFFLARNGFGNR